MPSLDGNESLYVNDCIDSGWISSRGEYVNRFETAFSAYLDGANATTVSNGTVALHLALYALGIGNGDEVIVPTFTYIASVNAISYVGATPIFVDANFNSWNIDCSKIEEKITKNTKAIMAVHLYGAVCDVSELQRICDIHNLVLIEDVAEAFGSKYGGRFAGTFGAISTFSFFGNKTITTGEGGMVVSSSEDLIKKVAHLKSQSVSPLREYWHDELGFNYRMTNICAAIGLAQLERAKKTIEKKILIANWYKEFLDGREVQFQKELEGTVHTYWMVSILLSGQLIKQKVRDHLNKFNIETRPLFYPAHIMPPYKRDEKFPIAEDISMRGVNLPSYSSLTKEQVRYISEKIMNII